MNSKGLSLLILGILLFLVENVFADLIKESEFTVIETEYINSEKRDTISSKEWKPCISPFVEVLGKGFLSVNVDFRIKESFALSAGFLAEGFAPNVMGYYLSGQRHRLEIGGGVSTGFNNEMKMSIFLIHGVIGYRYQKKHGLFFRAGFTPFFIKYLDENENNNKLYPFAGLSLGYSF